MLKQEQVLEIEPQNELKFIGPYNVPVTSYMKLTNPSDRKVMFKIKTTAPKKYCVRPNSGILDPRETIEIAICLQPFHYDAKEKNKHKFMVQTVFAPEKVEANLETLWKEIGPDELMDSKLKCVFDVPQEEEQKQQAQQQGIAMPDVKGTLPDKAAKDLTLELHKAAKEVQQLREVESELRQENIRLSEEILVLKKQKGLATPNRYAPPVEQPQTMYFVAIAVVIGLVGIFFGKILL